MNYVFDLQEQRRDALQRVRECIVDAEKKVLELKASRSLQLYLAEAVLKGLRSNEARLSAGLTERSEPRRAGNA